MSQHTAEKAPIPSPQHRREIAALALMPERQVLRVYREPGKAKPSTLARVARAARKLRITQPADGMHRGSQP